MVKKFVTSQAAVADHKLLVNSVSKRSCDKKNNLHSSVKVLKPKVYILTDSSSYKTLVQELTGNGNIGCRSVSDTPASLSSPCATTSKPIDHDQGLVIQNNMMYTSKDHGFQEISPELSFHSSDHRISPINIPASTIIYKPLDDEQIPVIENNKMYTTGDYGFQESSPEISFDSSDHHIDLISIPVTSDFSQEVIDYVPTSLISKDYEFQSSWDMMSFPEQMESWFSEMDSCVYNDFGSHWPQPVMPREVCAFDCDFSAIM